MLQLYAWRSSHYYGDKKYDNDIILVMWITGIYIVEIKWETMQSINLDEKISKKKMDETQIFTHSNHLTKHF